MITIVTEALMADSKRQQRKYLTLKKKCFRRCPGFLENKGLIEEATSVSLMVSTVAQLYCSSVAFNKQTTIDNYFDVQ